MGSSLVGLLKRTGNPFHDNEPSHIAAHLAKGEGFSSPYAGTPTAPTAQQPPLYPVLEAIVFRIFGVFSPAALRLIVGVNALAGAAIAALIYLVGRRYAYPLVGLLAGWVWALSPALAASDVFISNYALTTLLVLLWLLIIPEMPASTRAWILLGLASGLGVLLNPALILLFPASYGWLIKQKRYACLALAVTFLIMAPWIVRNYFVMGHFYPLLRDNVGLELYMGNHAGMNDHSPNCVWALCGGTYEYANTDRGFAEMGEPAFIQKKTQQAVAYIRASPIKFLQRSAKRFAAFWLVPYPWFYLIVAIVAWIGALQIARPLGTFFMIMLGLYPIVFYVTQAAWPASYRHPIEPLALLSAGMVLHRWVCGLSSLRLRAEKAFPG